MESNRYLLILFIVLFLCFGVAKAEDEYGVCFFPKDEIAIGAHSLRVTYRALDIPAAGIRSQIRLAVQAMNYSGEGSLTEVEEMDGTRIEDVGHASNGPSEHRIKIEWQSNAVPPVPAILTLSHKPGKKHLKHIDGTLSINGINQEVKCFIRPTSVSMLLTRKTYEAELIVKDIPNHCSPNTKRFLIGLGISAIAIAAYYCN